MLQLTCACPAPRHSLPRPFGHSTVGRLAESLSGMHKQPTSWHIHVVRSQWKCACVSRPLPTSDRAVGRDAREHITRFLEYKAACRAPVCTCIELSGSATSMWVQVSPQSELMGPSSADFALAPGILPRIGTYCVAIAVLMPFHSMTTTDSVQSISRGLADSPSEVLSPPSSSLKAAGSRVQSCRRVPRFLRDVTDACRPCKPPSTRHAVSGV